MIWTLVYCAFFVVIGFLITRWSDQRATDKAKWLDDENPIAFYITVFVFCIFLLIDPMISKAMAGLLLGYITRLYWVLLQLDGENDDGIEAEE
jgi:hypothetical protein